MEKDPAYSQVTARILLHTIRKEVFGKEVPQAGAAAEYITYFPQYIAKGIDAELLDEELGKFDLQKLAKAIVADRDLQFGYIGLQTLYDRYFLHIRETRIEMPQAFYMRVAMGLALREENREARAIEFYNLLSTLRLHELDPDPVQLGHPPLAAVVVLPDHRRRRPGRHLRRDQGKRAAVEIRRRPGQRLDPGARAGLAHQGHQRQVAGRGAVPESGQRHRRGGQPGRQAQGRGLRLPGNLAPGHRGIPRPAQEHRRRPPPHPRHEHRELDSGPVHEARDGKGRVDACSRRPKCRTCTTRSARPSKKPTWATKPRRRAAK